MLNYHHRSLREWERKRGWTTANIFRMHFFLIVVASVISKKIHSHDLSEWTLYRTKSQCTTTKTSNTTPMLNYAIFCICFVLVLNCLTGMNLTEFPLFCFSLSLSPSLMIYIYFSICVSVVVKIQIITDDELKIVDTNNNSAVMAIVHYGEQFMWMR